MTKTKVEKAQDVAGAVVGTAGIMLTKGAVIVTRFSVGVVGKVCSWVCSVGKAAADGYKAQRAQAEAEEQN